MKVCTYCGESKPLIDFSFIKAKQRPSIYCRPCQAHRSKLYYSIHGRKTAPTYRESVRRITTRSRMAVFRAIKRGVLVRPGTCSKCGKQGKIDAAHSDYENPLNVIWLCHSCHMLWDRAEPKTKDY